MLTVKDGPGIYRGQFFCAPVLCPLVKSRGSHPAAALVHPTNQIKS